MRRIFEEAENDMIKVWKGGREVLVVLILTPFILAACQGGYSKFYEVIFGNQEHGLICEQLPTVESVDQTLAEHEDTVEQILAINPGYVFLAVDRESCPGRADIIIWFATRDDSRKIQAILGDRTFFGVPVRLRNV